MKYLFRRADASSPIALLSRSDSGKKSVVKIARYAGEGSSFAASTTSTETDEQVLWFCDARSGSMEKRLLDEELASVLTYKSDLFEKVQCIGTSPTRWISVAPPTRACWQLNLKSAGCASSFMIRVLASGHHILPPEIPILSLANLFGFQQIQLPFLAYFSGSKAGLEKLIRGAKFIEASQRDGCGMHRAVIFRSHQTSPSIRPLLAYWDAVSVWYEHPWRMTSLIVTDTHLVF